MRYKNPANDTRQIVNRFLWFPVSLPAYYPEGTPRYNTKFSETRWLERTEIVQEYHHITGWSAICWNKETEGTSDA